MRYMLWQEILLFASQYILVGFLLAWASWLWDNYNPHMNTFQYFEYWTVGIQALITGTVLFFARIKAKYGYREIEDIAIYDRSLKQEFDFDSPAILQEYFQELRDYENQPYYYKKEVTDKKMAINVNLERFRPDSRPL